MNKRIEFGSLFQIGFYLVHVGHDCQHGPIRKKAPLEWGFQFVNRGFVFGPPIGDRLSA